MLYPLPTLTDGRKPVISHGYGEGSAITQKHYGLDFFYQAKTGDPIWPGKDTANRSKNYYMPDNVPVLAVANGTVRFAGFKAYGGGVLLGHEGGKATFYIHLAEVKVKEGQKVKAGDILGIVGGDPRDKPAMLKHLHFEYWPGGDYASRVDPAPLFASAVAIPPPKSGAKSYLKWLIGSILGGIGLWFLSGKDK